MNKRLIAWLLLAACLFVIYAYVLPSGVPADHECAGEHCAICLCASLREQLRQLLPFAAAVLGGLVLSCCAARMKKSLWPPLCALWTPVCLKVKLSD